MDSVVRDNPGESVLGLPVLRQGGAFVLEGDYFESCLETILRYVDGRPASLQRGLAVLLIRMPYVRGALDLASFYPFALARELEFDGNPYEREVVVRKDKNELYRAMSGVVRGLIRDRNFLTSFVRSRRNRTPVLLPRRHFNEVELNNAMERLCAIVSAKSGLSEADIKIVCDEFEKSFAFQRRKNSGYFRNSQDVSFQSPGRNLHGFMREVGGRHTASCFLSSRLRLGGALVEGFHYDCSVDGGVYSGTFPNCHDEQETRTGTPHLNVYSNDYVR